MIRIDRGGAISTARELLADVVDRDLCIGCGACAALPGSALRIGMGEDGRYRAALRDGADPETEGPYVEVCPFADGHDEDELARIFLDAPGAGRDPAIGTHLSVGAGHVTGDGFRDAGSSGGMTSWFLNRLFEEDEIDAVLHVKPGESPTDPLFGFGVSETVGQMRSGAKTRYYPVEMSGVLRHVRERPGRYAVVGVPCFIKAVRLSQLADPLLAERIKFCVGLVCGHLKSARFAESLAWEQGVPPAELTGVDFRVKSDERSDRYSVTVDAADGTARTTPTSELSVTDWGMGFFKYTACDYCDDVLAETADITFGDAWLPEFTGDPKGDNIVVTRSRAAKDVVDRNSGALQLTDISAERAARSQDAGLRHRREGLAYRLARELQAGRRVQRKRVEPSTDLPERRRRIYDIRTDLIATGDAAFTHAVRTGSFDDFLRGIGTDVARYRAAYGADGPVERLKRLALARAPGLTRRVQRALGR